MSSSIENTLLDVPLFPASHVPDDGIFVATLAFVTLISAARVMVGQARAVARSNGVIYFDSFIDS